MVNYLINSSLSLINSLSEKTNSDIICLFVPDLQLCHSVASSGPEGGQRAGHLTNTLY